MPGLSEWVAVWERCQELVPPWCTNQIGDKTGALLWTMGSGRAPRIAGEMDIAAQIGTAMEWLAARDETECRRVGAKWHVQTFIGNSYHTMREDTLIDALRLACVAVLDAREKS
jgi:hypothetical protein